MPIPIVNTHVHLPPNFSAFTTVAEAVQAGADQSVRAMGASNFYDQRVYARFATLAAAQGIRPLYGLEFITQVPDLADQGVRVNDPANPGRMYLTGKGIDPDRSTPDRARHTAAMIRSANDQRAAEMVSRLAGHFASQGFFTGVTAETIIAQVAERAGVPVDWVSLQERHIAQGFQERLAELPRGERTAVLAKAYGCPAQADIDDPAALQAEIRSRLLKIGTPGFAPEVPLGFDQAYAYIVDMGGIPCYPVLADGADPLCPFEASPDELAQALLARGIHAAELIPIRNHSTVGQRYVRILREAGLIVCAGTEHNTVDRIPLDPAWVDSALDDQTRQIFFEAACVIAAHASRVAADQAGYVDAAGQLSGLSVAELAAEGARLIGEPRPDSLRQ